MVEPTPSPRQPLDPIALAFGSSGVVLGVLLVLLSASVAVWFIWFLKVGQLSRMRSKNHAFEQEASTLHQGTDLVALARRHADSPGGRVVIELGRRQGQALTNEFLLAVAKRAIASEQQRASVLMPTLSSIASASPFIGLFGTVWGIMDAFLRIGVEKSASLPVVAPAIGEALIATAFGLVAAIPATIGYNYVDKRVGDFLEELAASSEGWVAQLADEGRGQPMPLGRAAAFPAVRGGQ
jgi:biopolymer transport protein TolQ